MSPFTPYDGGAVTLSAVATSALSQFIGSFGDNLFIYNKGPNDVHIRQGTSAVQAILSDLIIPLNTASIIRKSGQYLSAITNTNETAVLEMCPGNGESEIVGRPQSLAFQSDAQKVYLSSLLYGEDAVNGAIAVVRKTPVVSTYSQSLSKSIQTLGTANAKATPGMLKSIHATNMNAAIRYCQIYNSTGSTSGTPEFSFPMSAGSATAATSVQVGDTVFGPNGYYMSSGITWAFSTQSATYSAPTLTDHTMHLLYN